VLVQQVYSNAPAANAGFCDGDVLVRIGTNDVRCSADILNRMFYCHAGDSVQFTVRRDGTEKTITLIIGSRPAEEMTTAQRPPPRLPLQTVGEWPTVVPAAHDR